MRIRKLKLTLKLFGFLFVWAAGWVIAPVLIAYDYLSALPHKKRRKVIFNYFVAWLLICTSTAIHYWNGHRMTLTSELDYVLFFTAPTSWYLLRYLFDYHAPLTGAKDLYKSKRWKNLRYQTLRKYGRSCMLCGTTEGQMHVDHIKPRSKYPHLAYDPSNLQVLCADCNRAKSNVYEDDFRKKTG